MSKFNEERDEDSHLPTIPYQTPKRTGNRAYNINANLLNEGLFPRRMFRDLPDSYKLKSIKVISESNNGDRLELPYGCILYCLEMNLRD